MKWTAAKVIIDYSDCEYAADLISTAFYDMGLKGVVIEDPGLAPDEGWGDNAGGPAEGCAVIGYLPQAPPGPDMLTALEKRVHDLEQRVGMRCRIAYARIDGENWAESWKAFFQPERITGRITIKPTWRFHAPLPGEIVVEIDPGMAFGTGTHPTTAMCVRLIDRYVKRGDAFLDVGTGSGVLMAVAAKIGAGDLLGVDNDALAIDIAGGNLAANQVPGGRFELKTGNLLDGVQGRFDVIAANILVREVLAVIDGLDGCLAENGIFICSGFIEKDRGRVLAALRRQMLEPIEILKEDDWVAIAARRSGTPAA